MNNCCAPNKNQLNIKINAQLENISKLLGNAIGVITANKIKVIPPSADCKDMKMIDVRSKDEFKGEPGHIPDAELICLEDNIEVRFERL